MSMPFFVTKNWCVYDNYNINAYIIYKIIGVYMLYKALMHILCINKWCVYYI
jgi:hypothetical protein